MKYFKIQFYTLTQGHINTLNEESEIFTEQLYQKEKKSIQKHDSIKLDMISKVKQLTGDFHKLSAAQVSKISKGAIRKNQILGQSFRVINIRRPG